MQIVRASELPASDARRTMPRSGSSVPQIFQGFSIMWKKLRLALLLAMVAALISLAQVQADPDVNDTRLLSQPAISAKNIAFIYTEDLWVADLDGHAPAFSESRSRSHLSSFLPSRGVVGRVFRRRFRCGCRRLRPW